MIFIVTPAGTRTRHQDPISDEPTTYLVVAQNQGDALKCVPDGNWTIREAASNQVLHAGYEISRKVIVKVAP